MPDEWEDVSPAKPAYKQIIVSINASHIARGRRDNIFEDAPALAFREALQADWAMVGWGYAKTGHPGNVVKNWTVKGKDFPKWMKDYDHGRPVKPIDLELFLEYEKDNTPKPITRKPPRPKTFYDQEAKRIQLGLK